MKTQSLGLSLTESGLGLSCVGRWGSGGELWPFSCVPGSVLNTDLPSFILIATKLRDLGSKEAGLKKLNTLPKVTLLPQGRNGTQTQAD